MSCCRWLWNFLANCKKALSKGLHEYCQNNCITGVQYLVKPNYHPCERGLWLVIFFVGTCVGCTLIFNYMKDFSQNVVRIVDEPHYEGQAIRYPALGVCQIGEENDKEILIRLDGILNSSLYKDYPELSLNHDLKDILHMLTFQNLYDKKKLQYFLTSLETLPLQVQNYLNNFGFKNVTEELTYSSEELFVQCSWLGTPFNCCSVFHPVPTALGKCFLFNSMQTENTLASKMIAQIEIYKEPYILEVSFSKAAEIFLHNVHSIPLKIFSGKSLVIKNKGTHLTLSFKITPLLTDDSLLELDSSILGCLHDKKTEARPNSIYPFDGFSTCLTEIFFKQQLKVCDCINVNGPDALQKFCNLSQFRCLEQYGFLNTNLWSSALSKLQLQCPLNCMGSIYEVQEAIFKKISDADKQNVRLLHFNLYNFPTTHKRRQAIRQAEDKLASFSNILALFMGLNVINIIEFIYLTCCAFWKYNKRNGAQNATGIQEQ